MIEFEMLLQKEKKDYTRLFSSDTPSFLFTVKICPFLVNDQSQRGDRIEIFPVPNGQNQRHHLADHRQTPWAKVNS